MDALIRPQLVTDRQEESPGLSRDCDAPAPGMNWWAVAGTTENLIVFWSAQLTDHLVLARDVPELFCCSVVEQRVGCV